MFVPHLVNESYAHHLESSPTVHALLDLSPAGLTHLYGQLGIASSQTRPVHEDANVGADDGYVPCEPGDRAQEVAEQYHDAVELDAEPDQRPAQEDQQEAAEEGRRALGLLFPGEEGERLLRPDDDGEADEEEDLLEVRTKKVRELVRQKPGVLVRRGSWGGIAKTVLGVGKMEETLTLPMASLQDSGYSQYLLISQAKADSWKELQEKSCATHMARSKNIITPPIRKNPPVRPIVSYSSLIRPLAFEPRGEVACRVHIPPEQKATPISASLVLAGAIP